ncbi:UBC core domain-containing protein [Psidium guajava]|nr:UBC core domain-containing protein [Psidium guajava]
MMNGNGEARGVAGSADRNDALETIHAAATAIASAENRVPQAAVQVSTSRSFTRLVY